MRFSATLATAFAATALACNFEADPRLVDRFVKLRAVPLENEPLYTLEFSDGTTRQVTEAEKWDLKRAHIRFFDITDQGELAVYSAPQSFAEGDVSIAAFPTTLTQGTAVKALIPKYSTDNVKTTLTKFSSFFNRYYKSTYGVQSAQWLYDQVSATIAASGAKGVTVRKVTHTFSQFSVIATIPGTSAKKVVVGAHQDSINQQNPANGEAAGADDDGSGSMAILEALRVLLTDSRIAAGQAPNTLEFHWYAAEEAGLLGSQAVFQQYARDGANVAAMLQQDMVGYSPNNRFGVITDNTDAGLNTFTRSIIKAYTSTPYVDDKCGYGCSDHASATRSGYKSAMVFEGSFNDQNPSIHKPADTIEKINWPHVLEHGKLILGWMTELAFATSI